MKLRLRYLEDGRGLYAGYGLNCPVARWDGNSWQPYEPAEPKRDGWTEELSRLEAERCFPGATTTSRPAWLPDERDVSVDDAMRLNPEMFDSFDSRRYRHAPGEIDDYLDAVMPESLKALRKKEG